MRNAASDGNVAALAIREWTRNGCAGQPEDAAPQRFRGRIASQPSHSLRIYLDACAMPATFLSAVPFLGPRIITRHSEASAVSSARS